MVDATSSEGLSLVLGTGEATHFEVDDGLAQRRALSQGPSPTAEFLVSLDDHVTCCQLIK